MHTHAHARTYARTHTYTLTHTLNTFVISTIVPILVRIYFSSQIGLPENATLPFLPHTKISLPPTCLLEGSIWHVNVFSVIKKSGYKKMCKLKREGEHSPTSTFV